MSKPIVKLNIPTAFMPRKQFEPPRLLKDGFNLSHERCALENQDER